jgi:hypothetical protein
MRWFAISGRHAAKRVDAIPPGMIRGGPASAAVRAAVAPKISVTDCSAET